MDNKKSQHKRLSPFILQTKEMSIVHPSKRSSLFISCNVILLTGILKLILFENTLHFKTGYINQHMLNSSIPQCIRFLLLSVAASELFSRPQEQCGVQSSCLITRTVTRFHTALSHTPRQGAWAAVHEEDLC